MEVLKRPGRAIAIAGLVVCIIGILLAADFTARLFLESEDAVLEQHGEVQYLESVGRLLQPAYAGYITAGSTTVPSPNPKRPARVYDHHLYYYISPAQVRPETAPIILWTGGGERGEESALLGGFAGILPYTFQTDKLVSTLTTFQAKVDARVRAQYQGVPHYEALSRELDEEEAHIEAETKNLGAEAQENSEENELVEVTDLGVNPKAWNKHATVVLVDAIPGIGYSFTAPAPGSWPVSRPRRPATSATANVPLQAYFNSSETIALHLENFLVALAERYPDTIKGRDIILAGGGYMGGRVLPLLAERLSVRQPAQSSVGSVKGLLMIAPIIDAARQYAAIPSTLASMGLLDHEREQMLQDQVKKCHQLSKRDRKNKGSLARAKACAIPAEAQRILGSVRLQDIRQTCDMQDINAYTTLAKDASKALRMLKKGDRRMKRSARTKQQEQSQQIIDDHATATLNSLLEAHTYTSLPSPTTNAFIDIKGVLSGLAQDYKKLEEKPSTSNKTQVEVPPKIETAHDASHPNDTSSKGQLASKAKSLTVSAASGIRSLTSDLYHNIKTESSPPPFLQNPPPSVQGQAGTVQAVNVGGAPPAITAGLPQSGFRTPPKVLSDLGDKLTSKLPVLLETTNPNTNAPGVNRMSVYHSKEEHMNLVNYIITGFEGPDARVVHIAKGFLEHPRVKRQLFANGQPGVDHAWNSRAYEAHLALTIDSSRSSTKSLIRLMKSNADQDVTAQDTRASQPETKPSRFRLIIVGGQFDVHVCPNCLDRLFTQAWPDRQTASAGTAVTSVAGVSCMDLAHALVEAQKLVDSGLLELPQSLTRSGDSTEPDVEPVEDNSQASSLNVNATSALENPKRKRRHSRRRGKGKGHQRSRKQSTSEVQPEHDKADDTYSNNGGGSSAIDQDEVQTTTESADSACNLLHPRDVTHGVTAVNLLMAVKSAAPEVVPHVQTALKVIDSASDTPLIETLIALRDKCFVRPKRSEVNASGFSLVGSLTPRIKPSTSLDGYETPRLQPFFITSRSRGNTLSGYFRSGNRTQPLSQMVETLVLSGGAGGSLGVLQSHATTLVDVVTMLIKNKRMRTGGNRKKLLESKDPVIAAQAKANALRRAARREARARRMTQNPLATVENTRQQ